jgi:hypothetical protein
LGATSIKGQDNILPIIHISFSGGSRRTSAISINNLGNTAIVNIINVIYSLNLITSRIFKA